MDYARDSIKWVRPRGGGREDFVEWTKNGPRSFGVVAGTRPAGGQPGRTMTSYRATFKRRRESLRQLEDLLLE